MAMASAQAVPAANPAHAGQSITVLGSTGSVGCSTLDLVRRNADRYAVEALTTGRNVALLAQQAREFRARLAVVADATLYKPLKDALSGSGVEAAAGPDALVEAGARPADWVMAAIVGAAGIAPTLAAVARGAVVAFANKETLVCAGTLMTREIARNGATLLPVDSEHSAIFQVLEAHNRDAVERLILTASGGPFRTASAETMRAATPEQAVAHPVWSMGAKISVDSATLMNKSLEIIEAHHLFQLGEERIEVVVHPESVIHSMVGYVDGSVLAQLGSPDMRTPIGYALAWPERMPTPVERLDLVRTAKLTFEAPDPVRFPALRLARECLRAPASASAVFNAANEVAVQLFLERRIGFLDIVGTVERTLSAMPACALDSLEHMLAIDGEARVRAQEMALTPA